MAIEKAPMIWPRNRRASAWLLGVAAAAALCGCTIERSSQGSRITADPNEWIINGRTTKADVLRIFGPPDRIQRQLDGDVFTYSYLSKYSREFAVEEPASDLGFSYKRTDEKADRLVVLFGKEGVVSGFGYRRGTVEMPTGVVGMTPFAGDGAPQSPKPPAPTLRPVAESGGPAAAPFQPASPDPSSGSAVSATAGSRAP